MRLISRLRSLILSPAVRQQSRLLPQRHDPAWSVLNCFIERSPRKPVITHESDQLLDVRVRVVPKLDGIRKVERRTHSNHASLEQNGNIV